MTIALMLLLGCSGDQDGQELSADTASDNTNQQQQADTENTSEEEDANVTEDKETNELEEDNGLSCDDCTYLRYKVAFALFGDYTNGDAYVDIRIPEGKLENCELEGMHACFREKVSSDTVQFPPPSPLEKAEPYRVNNQNTYDIDGGQLFSLDYYASDRRGWQAVIHCSQGYGVIAIGTGGVTQDEDGNINSIIAASYESPQAGDALIVTAGEKLEYNPDDTCLADEQ